MIFNCCHLGFSLPRLKFPCVCVFLPSLWSNASYWENSAENNFTAPTDGANVIIPSGNVWENKLVSVMDFLVFKMKGSSSS